MERCEINVKNKTFYPKDLADSMLNNHRTRNCISKLCHWIMALFVLCSVLFFVAWYTFPSAKFPFLYSIAFLIIVTGTNKRLDMLSFDFKEANKYEYESVADYLQKYAAVKSYIKAIESSGRFWISNVEYLAVVCYVRKEEESNVGKNEFNEFKKARENLFKGSEQI